MSRRLLKVLPGFRQQPVRSCCSLDKFGGKREPPLYLLTANVEGRGRSPVGSQLSDIGVNPNSPRLDRRSYGTNRFVPNFKPIVRNDGFFSRIFKDTKDAGCPKPIKCTVTEDKCGRKKFQCGPVDLDHKPMYEVPSGGSKCMIVPDEKGKIKLDVKQIVCEKVVKPKVNECCVAEPSSCMSCTPLCPTPCSVPPPSICCKTCDLPKCPTDKMSGECSPCAAKKIESCLEILHGDLRDTHDPCSVEGRFSDPPPDPCKCFMSVGCKLCPKDTCGAKKDPCAHLMNSGCRECPKDPCTKPNQAKKDPCAHLMQSGCPECPKDPCTKPNQAKKDPCALLMELGCAECPKDPCSKPNKAKKDPCAHLMKSGCSECPKDSCGKKDKKDSLETLLKSLPHNCKSGQKDSCGSKKKQMACNKSTKGKSDDTGKTGPCKSAESSSKDTCGTKKGIACTLMLSNPSVGPDGEEEYSSPDRCRPLPAELCPPYPFYVRKALLTTHPSSTIDPRQSRSLQTYDPGSKLQIVLKPCPVLIKPTPPTCPKVGKSKNPYKKCFSPTFTAKTKAECCKTEVVARPKQVKPKIESKKAQSQRVECKKEVESNKPQTPRLSHKVECKKEACPEVESKQQPCSKIDCTKVLTTVPNEEVEVSKDVQVEHKKVLVPGCSSNIDYEMELKEQLCSNIESSNIESSNIESKEVHATGLPSKGKKETCPSKKAPKLSSEVECKKEASTKEALKQQAPSKIEVPKTLPYEEVECLKIEHKKMLAEVGSANMNYKMELTHQSCSKIESTPQTTQKCKEFVSKSSPTLLQTPGFECRKEIRSEVDHTMQLQQLKACPKVEFKLSTSGSCPKVEHKHGCLVITMQPCTKIECNKKEGIQQPQLKKEQTPGSSQKVACSKKSIQETSPKKIQTPSSCQKLIEIQQSPMKIQTASLSQNVECKKTIQQMAQTPSTQSKNLFQQAQIQYNLNLRSAAKSSPCAASPIQLAAAILATSHPKTECNDPKLDPAGEQRDPGVIFNIGDPHSRQPTLEDPSKKNSGMRDPTTAGTKICAHGDKKDDDKKKKKKNKNKKKDKGGSSTPPPPPSPKPGPNASTKPPSPPATSPKPGPESSSKPLPPAPTSAKPGPDSSSKPPPPAPTSAKPGSGSSSKPPPPASTSAKPGPDASSKPLPPPSSSPKPCPDSCCKPPPPCPKPCPDPACKPPPPPPCPKPCPDSCSKLQPPCPKPCPNPACKLPSPPPCPKPCPDSCGKPPPPPPCLKPCPDSCSKPPPPCPKPCPDPACKPPTPPCPCPCKPTLPPCPCKPSPPPCPCESPPNCVIAKLPPAPCPPKPCPVCPKPPPPCPCKPDPCATCSLPPCLPPPCPCPSDPCTTSKSPPICESDPCLNVLPSSLPCACPPDTCVKSPPPALPPCPYPCAPCTPPPCVPCCDPCTTPECPAPKQKPCPCVKQEREIIIPPKGSCKPPPPKKVKRKEPEKVPEPVCNKLKNPQCSSSMMHTEWIPVKVTGKPCDTPNARPPPPSKETNPGYAKAQNPQIIPHNNTYKSPQLNKPLPVKPQAPKSFLEGVKGLLNNIFSAILPGKKGGGSKKAASKIPVLQSDYVETLRAISQNKSKSVAAIPGPDRKAIRQNIHKRGGSMLNVMKRKGVCKTNRKFAKPKNPAYLKKSGKQNY